MSRSKDLHDEYEAKRVELIHGIYDQRRPVEARIKKNLAIAREHLAKSKELSDKMRTKEASEAMEEVSKLQTSIREDEALLKRLDADMALIHSGRHPELSALQSCINVASVAERHTELEEARAAFDALLTPELKGAAHRLVNASRATNPQALDLGQLLLS